MNVEQRRVDTPEPPGSVEERAEDAFTAEGGRLAPSARDRADVVRPNETARQAETKQE